MSNIIQSLRRWLQQGNRLTWAVFCLFCLVLFIKTMIFHWTCFHSVLFSSLWNNTSEFLRFWGSKLVPIGALASFVFITHRKWWTIVALSLIDIWMIANLFYYNANTLFLSLETIKLVDNLNGFWDSLFSYGSWSMVLLIFTTIAYACIVCFSSLKQSTRRYPLWFAVFLSLSMVVACYANYLYGKSTKKWVPQNSATTQVFSKMTAGERFHYYYPFGNVYYWAVVEKSVDYNVWCGMYVKEYSVLSYFPACFVYSMLAPAGEVIELTPEQKNDITVTIQSCNNTETPRPKTNLIFILFESMESWPLNEVCGYNYMPYLSNFIHSDHVLYCDKLSSQTKHGNSADGQMIAVTGMLPVSNGATCRLYGHNTYPNYAHFFERSAIINPAPGMWQQSVVTHSYGFKELIEPIKGEKWDDLSLLNNTIDYFQHSDSLFCVLAITVSSHVPFVYGSTHPKYIVEDMPAIMAAYLNCLCYTDSCIGILMDNVLNTDLANNTTVVISGDHTIFRSEDVELYDFAVQHGFNFQPANTRTPLIIYSPEINGNIHITDECYQMDIFPTILHLIGCENYYWRGLGVNLLDTASRHHRTLSEQEAYRLSDLLIRSDYFRQYYGR